MGIALAVPITPKTSTIAKRNTDILFISLPSTKKSGRIKLIRKRENVKGFFSLDLYGVTADVLGSGTYVSYVVMRGEIFGPVQFDWTSDQIPEGETSELKEDPDDSSVEEDEMAEVEEEEVDESTKPRIF